MQKRNTREIRSKDGTAIAFNRIGDGHPLILIDGALCYRDLGPSRELAELLGRHFTVFTYDRRGRGESTDTRPYAVERELEDIEAILNEAGGEAYAWGLSSGAVLALEAASRLDGITKLALYEAPFIVDASRPTTQDDWVRIDTAVARNQRGEAIKLFMQSVGLPRFMIRLMQLTPIWSKLKRVAHTLPYDGAIVKENQLGKPLSATQWAGVKIPTLVMSGGKSAEWMRRANQELAGVLPNAKHQTLEGQTHHVKPKVHAPALVEFFTSSTKEQNRIGSPGVPTFPRRVAHP